MSKKINEILKSKFIDIVKSKNLTDEKITIKTKVLSETEAIGNPINKDYPLLLGKERLMQARYKGSTGVAFSDIYGNYEDSLYNILEMKLTNNYRRAIFISVLNAVLKDLGLIERTAHCKNDELLLCRDQLEMFVKDKFGSPSILMIGFQPRFAEVLSEKFSTVILDMDRKNIGKKIKNSSIESDQNWEKYINNHDLIFVTGSAFVNDTASNFILSGKTTVFYGVTCAGPCYLLGLPRYCPQGN